MEILAYHKWLKQQSNDREELAYFIMDEVVVRNNAMAWDLLKETGQEKYTMDIFYRAADLIMEIKEEYHG